MVNLLNLKKINSKHDANNTFEFIGNLAAVIIIKKENHPIKQVAF